MTRAHSIGIDGKSIAAVYHSADSDRWLFFCHGFLSDKTGSYEARCERAVEKGYNAVRFDFRGNGESDGAFIESTLSAKIADLRAVVGYFDPAKYALFGSSFGAKVAFHAAVGGLSPAAIVARSPVTYNRTFDAYQETVETDGVFRYDPNHAIDSRFFDDFAGHPFENVTEDLVIPVAIFHGSEDGSVPIEDSFEAVTALETDVLFEKYVGEGHRFSEAAENRLRQRAFDWVASVIE